MFKLINMTPKDKALELYFTFEKVLRVYKDGSFYYDGKQAKNCCVILINEMLNAYPCNAPIGSYELEQHIFWNEVKNQMNNI